MEQICNTFEYKAHDVYKAEDSICIGLKMEGEVKKKRNKISPEPQGMLDQMSQASSANKSRTSHDSVMSNVLQGWSNIKELSIAMVK